jgi:hypothetical protein
MNERVDSHAIAREGSDATPWSSGVGARRVTVRTPGLRLGLLLFAAGLCGTGFCSPTPGVICRDTHGSGSRRGAG